MKRLKIFEELLEYNIPEIYNNFNSNGILTDYYLIEWIMTIFTKNLNVDLAARIWDLYMIEGIKALFQTSIAILMINKSNLINSNFDVSMSILKGKKIFDVDSEELMYYITKTKFNDMICFEIQKLDDEYIPLYNSNM